MLGKKMLMLKVLGVIATILFRTGLLAETIEQQYNELTNDIVVGELSYLDWVKRSGSHQAYQKDNLAIIRVQGTTCLCCSSIINGKFYQKAITPDTDNYPEIDPLSIMDLLYTYNNNPDEDGEQLVAGETLQEKITASKANDLRKLLEKMLTIAIKNYNDNTIPDIQNDIQYIITNGDLSLPSGFNTANYPERMELLKNSIVDFLKRLKKYANDVAFISDITKLSDAAVNISHHLEMDKKQLTNLDIKNCKLTNPGVIEILLEGIDKRIVGTAGKNYEPPTVDIELLVKTLRCLLVTISSPWCVAIQSLKFNTISDYDTRLQAKSNISQVTGAIFHTEQMVDWLSKYFGNNILVKISGKAPCLKCSHYIKYAQGIIGNWNARTVLGYNVGWSGRTPMLECMKYRYPIKVFNASSVNTALNPWTLTLAAPRTILTRKLSELPGTYSESDFGTNIGIDLSHCYAIENVDGVQGNEERTRYKGQLTIQPDGSIVQTKTDRGDDQLLIPYTHLSHTGDSLEEEIVE